MISSRTALRLGAGVWCLLLASCAHRPAREAEAPLCRELCATITTCAGKVDRSELAPKLCRIAECETGGKCTARIVSANGLYSGAFQFAKSTWRAECRPIFRRRGLDECLRKDSPHDACCAAACAAEMVAKDGAGAWPVCGRWAGF